MTDLPHFNPDDDVDPLPPAVADLRRRIDAADAVLFCTPEYAGALPGTFKNLLDWTVGGPEMYGKPVAWVNASGSPTRAAKAHESLETVLRTIHADVVAAACTHIAVARDAGGGRRRRRSGGGGPVIAGRARGACRVRGDAGGVGSGVGAAVFASPSTLAMHQRVDVDVVDAPVPGRVGRHEADAESRVRRGSVPPSIVIAGDGCHLPALIVPASAMPSTWPRPPS